MRMIAMANEVPGQAWSQAELLELLRGSRAWQRLRPGSLELLQRILSGDSGIHKRHFAADPRVVFDLDAEALNKLFEASAPALADHALRQALQRASLQAGDLDALFICTCTGYLCPGLSSFVAERSGLSGGVYLADHVGQGCGAAIPMLQAASQFLAAHPRAKVACVAVEICSAAFYLDDDAGVLVSACLFGDGASASLWTGGDGGGVRLEGFRSLHWPEKREMLRFENRGGKLRNRLHADVPQTAARAVAELYPEANGKTAPLLVVHPGGRKVLDAVRDQVPGQVLQASSEVLRDFGNMSSPSVMFALERAVADGMTDGWLCSFGAGFTCHACRVHV